ncbi:hypothetical protein ANCDUO_08012 [Ancylostoma duodenale]|uniref:Uncharacterized protein n=1 Tax=Ancylostoma duodenale TaxID=51022 RepID=A0A0C2DGY5_9BILA|nr:hypothetical protein ANCDUO_08012 [Ancylostoma duodenale]
MSHVRISIMAITYLVSQSRALFATFWTRMSYAEKWTVSSRYIHMHSSGSTPTAMHNKIIRRILVNWWVRIKVRAQRSRVIHV